MNAAKPPVFQLRRAEPPGPGAGSGLVTLGIVVTVVVALYFGRDIFVPLALAILLAFALAPLVRWLRRWRIPRLPAVLIVVVLAFTAIFAFGAVVTTQIGSLAQNLPFYQRNIENKIESVKALRPAGGVIDRVSEMLTDIREKITTPDELKPGAPAAPDPNASPPPVQVEIRPPPPQPLELLERVIGPLIGPLATGGIVVVFVIFMLLERQNLRDRVIRLAGAGDLHRTTEAIDDAGQRVGRYLIMQLAVNTMYAVPIGIGLWLIGVPNPMLWSMLALVLRFVPYIGPIVSATFPLLLSIAVDPGWSMLFWTGALFLALELFINNVVEPWLYGSSTGLSSIAIILAAIFWTWLWGPVGLMLSTPLTVCLAVLGRYVPQLAFLDVLLGSEPVLTPDENLYQRLLAEDVDEASERADECLIDKPLSQFYAEIALPALALAERDRARGILDDEHRALVGDGMIALIDDLEDHEDVVPESHPDDGSPAPRRPVAIEPPSGWTNRPVLCVAGRGKLDQAAASMLSQLVERRGLGARVAPFEDVRTPNLFRLETSGVKMICVSYMNPDSIAQARLLVRRLRRKFPEAPILVGLWTLRSANQIAARDPLGQIGADLLATSLEQAVNKVVYAAETGMEVSHHVPAEDDAKGMDALVKQVTGAA